MKLALAAFAVVIGGCASQAAPPRIAANTVSTTQLTSAEVGEKHAPTPKVGKADHVGKSHAAPSLGDDKTVTTKDGEARSRSYEVFGDWK